MPTETVLESNDIETVAPARVGDTLGYARVSTHDQNPDAQSDRLIEAGAIRVFTDIVSGKRFDRPALAELIDHARPGDRLCIIRLDRLGRSLRELLETVDGLKARAAGGDGQIVNVDQRLGGERGKTSHANRNPYRAAVQPSEKNQRPRVSPESGYELLQHRGRQRRSLADR